MPTNWLREELGLSLGLNYTMTYQHASRARGTNDGFFGDLDLLGRWKLIDFDGSWPGALAFQTESRHRMASDTPGQLQPRVGSQWSTALSSNPQRYAVVELYWEQGSFDDGLIARFGKLDAALVYDGGRFVSQNLAFLSAGFSDSPPMFFPAPGLGAAAAAYPNDWFYLLAGFQDANARRTQTGFNSIDDADFFYADEVGITPAFGTENEGLYHVTVWRSEKADKVDRRSGEGFQIHAEQQLGPDGHFVPFLR